MEKISANTDTIKSTTPFKTGTCIIIALTIYKHFNEMILIETILTALAKLSKYITILEFGIKLPYQLSDKHFR